MSLAEDETVSGRIIRFHRVNAKHVPIESDQKIHARKGAAEMGAFRVM
jgi:hypothetical protein